MMTKVEVSLGLGNHSGNPDLVSSRASQRYICFRLAQAVGKSCDSKLSNYLFKAI